MSSIKLSYFRMIYSLKFITYDVKHLTINISYTPKNIPFVKELKNLNNISILIPKEL